MQKKKGISLIVLVITIIVMIILAAAVIISMNNTGVIDKASHAVDLTNEKQVQDLASLLWAEAYLDEDRTDTIENVVKEGLAENKITDADWNINVSDTGVTVSKKENSDVVENALSGVWKFLIPRIARADLTQEINFVSGNNEYHSIKIDGSEIAYVGESSTYISSFGLDHWVDYSRDPVLEFGSTPQVVSEEFYDWFMDNAEPAIKFTIDGTKYYAEEGMTWEAWVASVYNTEYYYIESTYVVASFNDCAVMKNGTRLKSNQAIEPNVSYTFDSTPIAD